jgi:hypothetical protein
MNPMTELDVLKGLQASIAGLNLDEPMAVERAMALGASIERSAGRIIRHDYGDDCACGDDCVHPSHATGNDAMRAIADEPPFSEEPFAADIARTIAARKARPFKVGDRVRVTLGDRPWFSRGDIGIVEAGRLVNFNGQGNAEVIGDGRWFLGPYGMEHADSIPVATPEEDEAMDAIEQAHPAPNFAPLDMVSFAGDLAKSLGKAV